MSTGAGPGPNSRTARPQNFPRPSTNAFASSYAYSRRRSTNIASSFASADSVSAPATITSVDAIRNDPRTPQREWSLFETVLLEGEEHPLRRTASSASFAQSQGQNRSSFPSSLSTPGLGPGLDAVINSGTGSFPVTGTLAQRPQPRGRRASRAVSSYFPSGSLAGVGEQNEYLSFGNDSSPTGLATSGIASASVSRGPGVHVVSEEPEEDDRVFDSPALRAALLGPDNNPNYDSERRPLVEGNSNYDSDSDSDSDLEFSYQAASRSANAALGTIKPRFSWLHLPTLSTLQRDILKCSIAYFIGSLFTFNPFLSELVADISEGALKHLPGHNSI